MCARFWGISTEFKYELDKKKPVDLDSADIYAKGSIYNMYNKSLVNGNEKRRIYAVQGAFARGGGGACKQHFGFALKEVLTVYDKKIISFALASAACV
ncbi:MAG: hypothetical protein L6V93_05840 [Clostridiales bacterium]|nr:MAG: hypothetical protein L6V93_05840 [Clostridiales bacterium]